MWRSVLSGILVALGIFFPLLWPLVILGLALFLHLLWFKTASPKKAVLYGALFGALSGLGGIWFFWDSLPLDWSGIAPFIATIAVGTFVAYMTFALAILGALVAYLLWRIRDLTLAPLLGGIIVVLWDEARMWVLTLMTWSPQALLGPHFSPTSFGFPLAENPYLLSLAAYGGVAMLTFASALMASLLALSHKALRGEALRQTTLALGASVVLLSLPFIPYDEPPREGAITVALVSTALPNAASDYSEGKELLRKAGAMAPDIVLMPEGVSLGYFFRTGEERDTFMRETFTSKEALIIHSGYARDDGSATHDPGHEKLIYESTTRGVLKAYDKMSLVPFGEYEPAVATLLYGLMPDANLHEYLATLRVARTKGDTLTSVPFEGATIGALMCSEILSTTLYKRLVQEEGATLLVNIANHAWFHGSPALYAKTMQMAKVHAVENRRYFLVAMNAAPSFVITPTGTLLAKASSTPSVLLVEIPR